MFYNSTLNPENEGFCTENCLGNGVFNISTCSGGDWIFCFVLSHYFCLFICNFFKKGISGFLSQPHFLNAEAKFLDSIEGLAPDEDKHDSILHFEPVNFVLNSILYKLFSEKCILANPRQVTMGSRGSPDFFCILLKLVWSYIYGKMDFISFSLKDNYLLKKLIIFRFLFRM